MVVAARVRDDDRADFAQAFVWPVQGRISGRFGNQRIYNGTPKSPHSGMDIAAANGTPVTRAGRGHRHVRRARTSTSPAARVLLDHGHGVSSNFLHLSRIDVKVGDRVEQGQVIGAVGATGRATGPHLHWGMNWFDVRIDPLAGAGTRKRRRVEPATRAVARNRAAARADLGSYCSRGICAADPRHRIVRVQALEVRHLRVEALDARDPSTAPPPRGARRLRRTSGSRH